MKNSENSDKTRTNADRIREMPNEVLAEKICDNISCSVCPAENLCLENEIPGPLALKSWLESEAEE